MKKLLLVLVAAVLLASCEKVEFNQLMGTWKTTSGDTVVITQSTWGDKSYGITKYNEVMIGNDMFEIKNQTADHFRIERETFESFYAEDYDRIN